MKRCFIIICLALMTLTANSQEVTQHLKFMGIDINGRCDEFVQNLKTKGFKRVTEKNDRIFLSGTFAGQINCMVSVIFLPSKQTVLAVEVYFPPQTFWPTMVKEYMQYKKFLTKKYGEPAITPHKDEFIPNGVGNISSNTNHYVTKYKLANGDILLSFNVGPDDSVKGYCTTITYSDKQNAKVNNDTVFNDL